MHSNCRPYGGKMKYESLTANSFRADSAHIANDPGDIDRIIDKDLEQKPDSTAANEPVAVDGQTALSEDAVAQTDLAVDDGTADGQMVVVSDAFTPDSDIQDTDEYDDSLIVKNGLPEYRGDAGGLMGGLDRLGKLGTFHWDSDSERDEWQQGLSTRHGSQSEPKSEPEPEPGPVILNGVLRLHLVMREDGQPFKHQPSDPSDPHCPSDGTFEDGYDPLSGMPIASSLSDNAMPLSFSFDSSAGSTGADSLYLHCFTATGLPDPSQGVVYYNGLPLELGVTIDVPDMNGFTFIPAPYFSGTVALDFTYVLCTDRTGPASNTQQGEAVFVVDSVADQASASTEATGESAQGNGRELGEAFFGNGWASQEAAVEDSMLVTFTVTARFYDLDGSETAWIDVALPPGFSIPEGSGLKLVENESGRFARIRMPDLTTLRDSEGLIKVPVTLEMDSKADAGAKSLSVSVYTYETDGLDSGGFQVDNNLAVRTIDQEIEVDLLPGAFNVQAGWAYEGGKSGGTAAEDITQIGLDQNSTTDNGAPLIFSLHNGSFSGGTVAIDPALGTLYHDGVALTPDENGIYTLSAAQLNGGRLSFMPSGHSDGDVPVQYSLEAVMDNGSGFTFSGNTSVVVDAVADAAVLDKISAGADANTPR